MENDIQNIKNELNKLLVGLKVEPIDQIIKDWNQLCVTNDEEDKRIMKLNRGFINEFCDGMEFYDALNEFNEIDMNDKYITFEFGLTSFSNLKSDNSPLDLDILAKALLNNEINHEPYKEFGMQFNDNKKKFKI